MKRWIWVAACFGAVMILSLPDWSGALEEALEGPRISVREPRFDFKPVLEGAVIEHEYRIENSGKADLMIQNVHTSCGCTTADYTRVIPPGGTGRIVIKGNTEGYGGSGFSKTITVISNDRQEPEVKLYINGRVRRFVGIEPRQALMRAEAGKPAETTVRITPEPDYPFRIIESHADEGLKEKIAFTLRSEEDRYVLTIANRLKTVGRYWGVIHLKTDSKEKSELLIRVTGIISEAQS
ncbi:MAG: OS_HP2 family (seleno)protein [Thermodesulfobacteriota bacterium]